MSIECQIHRIQKIIKECDVKIKCENSEDWFMPSDSSWYTFIYYDHIGSSKNKLDNSNAEFTSLKKSEKNSKSQKQIYMSQYINKWKTCFSEATEWAS